MYTLSNGKLNANSTLCFVRNLWSFMFRWDGKADLETSSRIENKLSQFNNLNIEGTDLCFQSNIATRWHKDFYDLIEPGIREGIQICIEKLNCITYSSCEGHIYNKPDGSFSLRCISIVPRNLREHEYYLMVFREVRNRMDTFLNKSDDIYLKIEVSIIETNDGPRTHGLTIIFYPRTFDAHKYFDNVEKAHSLFCEELQKLRLSNLNIKWF
jgi:hypothetical protein